MRNEILHNIARFSLSVEKVPDELFELLKFDADSLRKISSLVRSKQTIKKNYNTTELGWGVCGEEELNKDEMEILVEFISNLRNRFLSTFLNMESIRLFNHHCI